MEKSKIDKYVTRKAALLYKDLSSILDYSIDGEDSNPPDRLLELDDEDAYFIERAEKIIKDAINYGKQIGKT